MFNFPNHLYLRKGENTSVLKLCFVSVVLIINGFSSEWIYEKSRITTAEKDVTVDMIIAIYMYAAWAVRAKTFKKNNDPKNRKKENPVLFRRYFRNWESAIFQIHKQCYIFK